MNEKEISIGKLPINKKHPVMKKKFDVTTEFYCSKKDEKPKFAFSMRGDVEVDLLRLAIGLSAGLLAGLILSAVGKAKK